MTPYPLAPAGSDVDLRVTMGTASMRPKERGR